MTHATRLRILEVIYDARVVCRACWAIVGGLTANWTLNSSLHPMHTNQTCKAEGMAALDCLWTMLVQVEGITADWTTQIIHCFMINCILLF